MAPWIFERILFCTITIVFCSWVNNISSQSYNLIDCVNIFSYAWEIIVLMLGFDIVVWVYLLNYYLFNSCAFTNVKYHYLTLYNHLSLNILYVLYSSGVSLIVQRQIYANVIQKFFIILLITLICLATDATYQFFINLLFTIIYFATDATYQFFINLLFTIICLATDATYHILTEYHWLCKAKFIKLLFI